MVLSLSTELAGEGDKPEVDSTEDVILGDAGDMASEEEGMRIERLDGFVATPDDRPVGTTEPSLEGKLSTNEEFSKT